MKHIQTFVLMVLAVLSSGLLLDVCSSGQLGEFAQKIAKKCTNGYGDFTEVKQ